MSEPGENNFECSHCKSIVAEQDEFCPSCGALFEDGVNCTIHKSAEAEGVCTICCHAFCGECGARENNLFLCNSHYHYEIYQQMARIYGSLDDTEIQFIKSCLEKDGFHPVIFAKSQPKGGSRLVPTLFESSGDSKGHIVNEIKLMVPCQEVIPAEELLRKLSLIQ